MDNDNMTPESPVVPTITPIQRLIAISAHISYLFFGLGFVLVPLLILILEKDKDEFVAEHAKQALIAQSFIAISMLIVCFLSMLIIGVLLMPILGIIMLVWFICSILAVWNIANDKLYKYPLIGSAFSK